METTKHQNELMWHTIGLGTGENRNWFGTSLGNKDSEGFEELIKIGLAEKRNPPSWCGDDVIYSLTEKGIEVANETFPKPKKLTRSKARYQRYLEYGDSFDSFKHFLGWDCEKEREWN